MDIPKLHITNMISEEIVREEEFFLFGFASQEVETPDYTRADELIGVMASVGRAAKGKAILTFAYDDDPREIFEIPEINIFVREILVRCPHLFYYLYPDTEVVRPLIHTLCGVKKAAIINSGRTMRMVYPDMELTRRTIRKLLYDAEKYGETLRDMRGLPDMKKAIEGIGIPL